MRSDLALGDGGEVHLVRSISQLKDPRPGPEMGERGVLAQSHRAVALDGAVNHRLGHARGER
jgi:hypothetical protein